jgi:hypothetical protein
MTVNGKNLKLVEPAINDPKNWFYDPPENSHIGEGLKSPHMREVANQVAQEAFGKPVYPEGAAVK